VNDKSASDTAKSAATGAGRATGKRDRVEVRITTDVRIRARWVADRLEVRFGKASPVVLVVERDAYYDLADAINNQACW
jgi:hypothetical protein